MKNLSSSNNIIKERFETNPFTTDDIVIKSGTPAELIVQTAKERNCDVIVMDTHGHGVIADVLMRILFLNSQKKLKNH